MPKYCKVSDPVIHRIEFCSLLVAQQQYKTMAVGGAVFTANRLPVQFISVSSLVTTCLKKFSFSSMWMVKCKLQKKTHSYPFPCLLGPLDLPLQISLSRAGRPTR